MKTQQWLFAGNDWQKQNSSPGFDPHTAQLVLAFGEPKLIKEPRHFHHIKELFPGAHILLSSTAGEINNGEVLDDSIVVTAIHFEKTKIRGCISNINKHDNSFEAGKFLFNNLTARDLQAVFVISDGKHINGSELVQGLNKNNTSHLPVTGGLAGDGAQFKKTFVGLNQVP